jgi:hypothetical protein
MKVILALFLFMASAKASSDTELLFKDYFDWKKLESPEKAYYLGLEATNVGMNNFSMAALEERKMAAMTFRNRAEDLLKSHDAMEDLELTRLLDMIRYETNFFVEKFDQRGFLMAPVNWLEGVQGYMPQYFATKYDFK